MDKLSILILVGIVFGVVLLFLVFATVIKPSKKAKIEEKVQETKPEGKVEPEKEEKPAQDDIPEILKEVTSHNYMRERAIENTKTHEFSEGDMQESKSSLAPKKQIHRIQPIEDDNSQGDDLDDILNKLDNDGEKSQSQGNSVVEEFRNMSQKMKTIIVADALKRKDDE
ncbi:MAG: hypothetical protein IK070_02935 [Clostridia bacterium]|nr:hypothetical protein [Clostridia bacterium]